jgi:hypothetical protein
VPYPPIYGYDFYKNKAKRSYILNIEKKMMSDKNGARQAKVRLSRNEYSMGEDKRERERTYRIPVLSIRAAVLTLYNGTIRKEDQNMRQCKIQYMIRKGYDSVRNSV